MAPDVFVMTVRELVNRGVLERPIDGNHGELHPKASDFVASGIPFIMASDLKGGRIDTVSCAFISETLARSLRKGFARSGDVLLSHKATIGRTALVGRLEMPFLMLTPQVTYYRVHDPSRLEPLYLKAYFDSPQFQELFNRWANKGSTRAYLGISAQLDLPIIVPPIERQRAITHMLGSLDDKIELNRRTNETLEEMARTLFKSWFVDFDPVRDKARGTKPRGVAAELAKLFPTQFEDSEIGEIPKGWSVLALDQLADFKNGLALQRFRPTNAENQLPVIKIAQLRTGEPDSGEWARADLDAGCILENGDVVFSWSGSLAVVVWCGGRGALNQHLFKVTSRTHPKWFFLGWLRRHLAEFQRIAGDKATTMGHIQRHHLSAAKCAVPPRALLERASSLFDGLLARIIANELQNRTLTEIRDALLPRLLSGELSVGKSERLLEELSS